MKNDWSKLEGKQVIMFGVDAGKRVTIGEIVGCDPDIGICIADVGKTDPWFVAHGPKSPLARLWPWRDAELVKLELESIYEQLQSGYFSKFVDERNEMRIHGEVYVPPPHSTINCPFSM